MYYVCYNNIISKYANDLRNDKKQNVFCDGEILQDVSRAA